VTPLLTPMTLTPQTRSPRSPRSPADSSPHEGWAAPALLITGSYTPGSTHAGKSGNSTHLGAKGGGGGSSNNKPSSDRSSRHGSRQGRRQEAGRSSSKPSSHRSSRHSSRSPLRSPKGKEEELYWQVATHVMKNVEQSAADQAAYFRNVKPPKPKTPPAPPSTALSSSAAAGKAATPGSEHAGKPPKPTSRKWNFLND
jgi:hypothetical protein